MTTPTLDPPIDRRPVDVPPVDRAPAAAPRRRLPFDRLFDVRDLGGYRGRDGAAVRWGLVYRGDDLGRVRGHADDLARLDALGLGAVVDLRSADERRARPCAVGEDAGDGGVDDVTRDEAGPIRTERFEHPVLAETWAARGQVPPSEGTDAATAFLAERYVEMLDEGAGAIGSVLALCSDRVHLPLLFHGSLGKDRTGVVAAVLLALLGVDDAVIANDYGLSRMAMAELVEWAGAAAPEEQAALLSHHPAHLDAPPSAIRGLLSQIRTRWGGVEAYADSLCVDERAVARIRANLLEPSAAP